MSILITTSSFAQNPPVHGTDEGGPQNWTKMKELRQRDYMIRKAFVDRWKECIGVDAPILTNLPTIATLLNGIDALKKFETSSDASHCGEVQCLIDEDLAQKIFDFTEAPEAYYYLNGNPQNKDKDPAEATFKFFRELNSKKMKQEAEKKLEQKDPEGSKKG